MNGCEDFLELLDSFLDGELPPDQMLRVQAHLDACPACREYVDDVLTLRAAFPSVEDTVVPEGFADTVMERVRASTPKPVVLRRRRWMGTVAALAACCALVVLLRSGPVGLDGGWKDSTAVMEDAVESAACEDVEDVSLQSAGDASADGGAMDDTDMEAPARVEGGFAYDTTEDKEEDTEKNALRNTSGAAPESRIAPAEDVTEHQVDFTAGLPSALSEPAPGETSDVSAAMPEETAPTAGPQENAPVAGSGEDSGPLMAAVPAPAAASAKTGGQAACYSPEAGDVTLDDADLILSQEEAGDLLDGFTLAEDNGSERTYLLTQEEFAGLLELLPVECDVQKDKELITVVVTAA